MHLEGPFATERCYPYSVGRSSLSLLCPSEEIPLESWLRLSTEPPLMGFATTTDKSEVVAALQSVKELKGGLFSEESNHPLWGFLSWELVNRS